MVKIIFVLCFGFRTPSVRFIVSSLACGFVKSSKYQNFKITITLKSERTNYETFMVSERFLKPNKGTAYWYYKILWAVSYIDLAMLAGGGFGRFHGTHNTVRDGSRYNLFS